MSKKILICGDSWSLGELNPDNTQILHRGLEQYFIDDGHAVTNIGKGGLSNLDIANRLQLYLESYSDSELDMVLVFQTEFTRDFKHDHMQICFGTDDWQGLRSVHELASKWVERFYMRLSAIAVKHDVPVLIVGGCSDALHFDDMSKDYPGCVLACQSMVNLLINGVAGIDDPVLSWYARSSLDTVQRLKHQLTASEIDVLLKEIDRGYERSCLLAENPQWFYPDGRHANRQGHKALYDYLVAEKFLKS